MRSAPSAFGRMLEPLAAALWVLFVLVSLLVGVVWALPLGDAALERWISPRDLRATLEWLLQRLDLLWISLAAANVYLSFVEREGLATARRWGLLILTAVVGIAWLSTRTSFPLGPIQYGYPLGSKLGPVPLGLPLFWLVVIIGAREGLLHFFGRWSHGQIALVTAFLAALTDISLEPLAAKLRGFWFWRASSPTLPPVFDAPLTGCLAWGLLAGLLAFVMREQQVAASVRPRSWKPAAAFAIFHAVFLAAHLGRWLRD